MRNEELWESLRLLYSYIMKMKRFNLVYRTGAGIARPQFLISNS